MHQKHQPRNTSDTCWIYCFYATILGAPALVPGGATIPLKTGMPRAQIEAAFNAPFSDESQGGCPAINVPPNLLRGQPPRPLPSPAALAARATEAHAYEQGRSADARTRRSWSLLRAMVMRRVYRETFSASMRKSH
uniref:Uncharacterized protein n=1 Tax=Haptolina brevifila TaxID=156173 RepID=A0A7S2E0Y0_9EUKA|mmetsp:Transcript_46868/g.93411  ORF Transcript_46868/g.93411 Transcript_46868/m.93411 type:complete len:136 (+) Transcript_46868:93-500(+)